MKKTRTQRIEEQKKAIIKLVGKPAEVDAEWFFNARKALHRSVALSRVFVRICQMWAVSPNSTLQITAASLAPFLRGSGYSNNHVGNLLTRLAALCLIHRPAKRKFYLFYGCKPSNELLEVAMRKIAEVEP